MVFAMFLLCFCVAAISSSENFMWLFFFDYIHVRKYHDISIYQNPSFKLTHEILVLITSQGSVGKALDWGC